MEFYETSAKQDIAVEKGFIRLAEQVKNRMVDGEGNGSGGGTKLTASMGKPKPAACC